MDSPIRVLHVVVNMNRGGAETLIMNLYRNIDRSSIQFDFLTCKEGVFDQEIEELGGRIHRIPYITDVGHFRYLKYLNQFFQNNKHYKIVHSHMDKMSGFVLRAAKRAGISVRIAHSHNTQSEGGIASKIYKSYAGGFINKNSTHYLACSNTAANWLFKEQGKKAVLLKNGIETDKFLFSEKQRQDKRKELGFSDHHYVIGHVGRFNHQKNHDFLLDIFNDYTKMNSQAVLVLVGDGTLRTPIEKKINELNLNDKVKLVGVRSDIEDLLQTFDVFVFPSLHEGLPVTLVEAQGAGLPCLISNQITKEVDMGIELVNYLPLSSRDLWVKEIQNVSNRKYSRSIPKTALKEKGYDISKTAEVMKDYYMRIER